MAQTRRRRQTKHRGNAAGVVEARGRTGRKPTAAEKNPNSREAKVQRAKSVDRRDQPPTWGGAFIRAMVGALAVLAAMVLLFKATAVQALPIFLFVLVVYVPIGYYTETWAFRRRQRSKARQAARGKTGGR